MFACCSVSVLLEMRMRGDGSKITCCRCGKIHDDAYRSVTREPTLSPNDVYSFSVMRVCVLCCVCVFVCVCAIVVVLLFAV